MQPEIYSQIPPQKNASRGGSHIFPIQNLVRAERAGEPEPIQLQFYFFALCVRTLSPAGAARRIPGALKNHCLLLAWNIIPSLPQDVNWAERSGFLFFFILHNHGLNPDSTLMFIKTAAERKQAGSSGSNGSTPPQRWERSRDRGIASRVFWMTLLARFLECRCSDEGHVNSFLKTYNYLLSVGGIRTKIRPIQRKSLGFSITGSWC